MKSKILITLTLCLLLAPSLQADNVYSSEDVILLRQEIRKQEIVLQALKEKLQRIEEENEAFYEISISSTGMQIEGESVSPQKLEEELKALPEGTKIMIRAESTVKHESVASVMKLCAKADLSDVVFVTTQAEPAAAGQRR